MKSINRLCIVSHVTHYTHAGKFYAYGPYAREIEIWADLFPEVVIAAPCRREMPPKICLPLNRTNISIRPQSETGGDSFSKKASQLVQLPAHVWNLSRAMRDADAIHVRCPGNLGLLGCLLAPLFSRHLIAKYAGQWNGYAGERLAVRLQRAILASRWWRGPVTVYGEWPAQSPHIVPFFTSMMTSAQVAHAARLALEKRIAAPLRVLFMGRLSPEKRVRALLEAVKVASERGARLELKIVGDGPEGESLRALVQELGICERVGFTGELAYEDALRWCEWAHCLVLPSVNSEGWPKVVAEGMCYGLVCVAVRHGQVPDMLAGRGILLEQGSADEIADALADVAANPAHYLALGQAASAWSQRYSLDSLRQALAELLAERWQTAHLFHEGKAIETHS